MADSKVEEYLLLVKGTKGRATADLVQKVTSEPGIFAFGEFLDASSVVQLKGTDVGSPHNLLQLFAYGDWPAYQASPSCPLNKEQERKLRQLTVMSKAENCKTLAYEELQRDLGLHNVRELEDFLITDCFYTGIVRGKLDQKQRCLHVLEVVGRDVPREELGRTMQGLAAWLAAAQNMQLTLQQNVTMAQKSAEEAEKMRTQQEQQIKRVKDNLKPEPFKKPWATLQPQSTAGLAPRQHASQILGDVQVSPGSGMGPMDTEDILEAYGEEDHGPPGFTNSRSKRRR